MMFPPTLSISQILDQPSPNEGKTEAENEYVFPDYQETEDPVWPPRDRSHLHSQKKEELLKEIDGLEKQCKRSTHKCPQPSVKADHMTKWLRADEELRAKKKLDDEEENKIRQEQAAIRSGGR